MLHKCCNTDTLGVLLIYLHTLLGIVCPWEMCIYSYQSNPLLLCCNISILYCLKLWPRRLFPSSNFSPRPPNETGNYTRPAFISYSSESKFFGWWILMEAGDTHVADSVDTVVVHHEMDSTVHSHCVYKPVWSRIGKHWGSVLILEKEPAGQSTRWICSTWQW